MSEHNRFLACPKGLAAVLAIITACFVCVHPAFAGNPAAVTSSAGHWKTATTAWQSEHTGKSRDPYVIATSNDLAGLAKLCDDGDDFKDKYFVLAGDIDLEDKSWEPIGWFGSYAYKNVQPFNGTVDGRGYEISGLFAANAGNNSALFGYIGAFSTVKNLRVSGRSVANNGGSTGAAIMTSWLDGLVENCVVSGDVTATSDYRTFVGPVAMLMGNYGKIRNVVTRGTVYSEAGFSYGGGVLGYTYASNLSIENAAVLCTSIYGRMDAGGVVGGNLGMTDSIYNNSAAAASIKAGNGGYAGGVTGNGRIGENNHWLYDNPSQQPDYASPYGGGTNTTGRVSSLSELPVVAAEPLKPVSVFTGETANVAPALQPTGGTKQGLVFAWSVSNSSVIAIQGQADGESATIRGVSESSATVTLVIRNSSWKGTGKITLTFPVTVKTPTAPTAPLNVIGTPGNAQVTLRWDAPESDGGREITGYRVSVGDGEWTDAGSGFSYTFNNLTNGTSYSFRVRAVNSVGDGGISDPVVLTPRETATAPETPRDLSATPGDGQVALTWTVPESDGGSEITRYEITSGDVWIDAGNVTSYTSTGLTNGVSYSFKVRAVNGIDAGEATETVSAVPRTVATMPLNLKAVSGDASMTISWSAPASNGGAAITGYLVLYDDSEWMDAESGSSHTFTGLEDGKSYTFKVRAVNVAGEGEIASITTKLNAQGGQDDAEDEELAGEEPFDEEEDEEEAVSDDVTPDDGSSVTVDTEVSTIKEAESVQAASTAGLPDNAFVADSDGNLVFNGVEATVVAQETWPDQEILAVTPLPIVRANVGGSGDTAEFRFTLKGSEFLVDRAKDVRVMKVKREEHGDSFEYAGARADFGDRRFTILKDGKIYGGVIEPDNSYTLVLFVKDGGDFDLDPSPVRVLDPAVIVKSNTRTAQDNVSKTDDTGSGGSGGCSSGAAALFAVLSSGIVAAFIRRD